MPTTIIPKICHLILKSIQKLPFATPQTITARWFSLFGPLLKLSYDDLQQGSVCNFCLSISLWVGGWGVVIPDSQLLAELFEGCVIKLSSIVWDEYPRDSNTVDNVIPDEAFDILLSEWFYFHPFSKIINLYH